jgi:hypothetical protein
MVRPLAAIFFAFCCHQVFSQQTLAEFGLPKGHDPSRIQFVSLNEVSVLLYEIPYTTSFNKSGIRPFNTLLISKKGEARYVKTDFFKDKVICGAVEGDQQILFYYFELERKNILIKGANLNLQTHEVSMINEAIIVPGKFLGSHVNGDQLFVYAFEKNSFLIKVLEVQGLQVKSEKDFKLPVDLSKFRASEIAFIPESTQVGSMQATARVKVMPTGKNIAIVVDDPFKEYEERAHLYKTTAIEIDSETGQSSMKVFAEETRHQFRSTIFQGHLFRTVNSFNEFKLQIYDLKTGSEVFRQLFPRDNAAKEVAVIFRENSTNHFAGQARLFDMIGVSDMCLPFVMVEKNETNGNFFLTWGTYWERNAVAPVGPNLLGMLVGIAGTAVYSSMDGPGVTRHFDIEGNVGQGFKVVQGQSDFPVRRKIDAFEMMQNVNRVKYRRKGYFQYGDATLGLYYYPSLNKMSLVQFK